MSLSDAALPFANLSGVMYVKTKKIHGRRDAWIVSCCMIVALVYTCYVCVRRERGKERVYDYLGDDADGEQPRESLALRFIQ
jgi:hypothetical protein